jgi:nucleotide-binding universal stress UspA family protein
VTGQSDSVDKRADEVLSRAVDAAGEGATGVIEPGPPDEVLESIADREAARLIVITARGAGGVAATLLGSVAAELTVTAARPSSCSPKRRRARPRSGRRRALRAS